MYQLAREYTQTAFETLLDVAENGQTKTLAKEFLTVVGYRTLLLPVELRSKAVVGSLSRHRDCLKSPRPKGASP